WEWSEDANNLATKRSDTTVVTVPANVSDTTTMVLLGGCTENIQAVSCQNVTDRVDIYYPETDTYQASTPMLTPRYRFSAAALGANIFIFGGRTNNDTMVCEVDMYNVDTEEWTALVDWVNCTSDSAAFVAGDNVIALVGGYDANYTETSGLTTLVTVGTGTGGTPTLTFTDGMPIIEARGDHECWSDRSTVAYCMGGFNLDDQTGAKVSTEKYDIAKGTWAAAADMTSGRGDFVLDMLNDRLTVVGGEDNQTGITDVEWYDLANDCWTSSSSLFELPFPRFRFGGAVDPLQSKMYVFGGQGPRVNNAYWPLESDVFWYQETPADTATGAAPLLRAWTAIAAAAVAAAAAMLA
ncbi:hypothetical protein JKP88DRAFT_171531, partial [Tribonema minus]